MRSDLAFERFVREHTATLYRTAFLLTGNRYEAEELLQARCSPEQRIVVADTSHAYTGTVRTTFFVTTDGGVTWRRTEFSS